MLVGTISQYVNLAGIGLYFGGNFMKKDIYWYITILAMVTMPAAAAINFGHAAYAAFSGKMPEFMAIIAGIATAIGFEVIGISAGHRSVVFHRQRDQRWKFASGILAIYIIIGTVEMASIPFARFVPILSGLVYILAGLEFQSTEESKQKSEDDSYQKKLDLLQVKLDHERQMKQDELNMQVKIERAKIKAMPASSQNSSQKIPQKVANKSAKHYECVCGRVFEGSRSYNAHRSHCEIPANAPAKIYENGSNE